MGDTRGLVCEVMVTGVVMSTFKFESFEGECNEDRIIVYMFCQFVWVSTQYHWRLCTYRFHP